MKVKYKKVVINQHTINKRLKRAQAEVKASVHAGTQSLLTRYEVESTYARGLIQAGKQTAMRFFQDIAEDIKKCRPVEDLFASYQRDIATYRDQLSTQDYVTICSQLKTWRECQTGHVLHGQEIEAFSGLDDMLAAAVQSDVLSQVNETINNVISRLRSGAPSALATSSTAGVLVGAASLTAGVLVGAASLIDTPVWDIGNYSEGFEGRYRTAVMEYFVSGLETMRPKTGKLELVVVIPQETYYKTQFHAVTPEQWLPLPSALTDKGEPKDIYYVDPQIGHIYWSPELGQFYLELLQKPTGSRQVTVTAYWNNGNSNWLPHLTPYIAILPAFKPNADIKSALSPFTRQVFEDTEKMGRQDLYGEYALTPYEQLQYAAARLKGSWTYDRQPKNLSAAKADGMKWLNHLHQENQVTTANCNVANTEFAVAARAFGYPVRIVTGFLGNGLPTLDTPGHEWVEMRVGNAYKELDTTPGYTLKDEVAALDNDLLLKLQRIAAYDKDPHYRTRNALYAQLPQLLGATGLQQLFDVISTLPIEEERLESDDTESVLSDVDRWVTDQYIGIRKEVGPGKWREDVYNRDPLRPNEQGQYRGYVISTVSTPLNLMHPLGFCACDADELLEWHMDVPCRSGATKHMYLQPRRSLEIPAITGEIVPGNANYISIQGYPGKRFQVCSTVDDIQQIWDPRDKQGRSTLVEGLQTLKFVPVRVTVEEDGPTEESPPHKVAVYDAFNAETGILIDYNFKFGTERSNMGTDVQGRRWQLETSPDYTRILATELSTETYRDHTNHAVIFANAFFEHMQGRQIVTAGDRGLLARALTLLLRHPPKLGADWHAIASVSYLLSEARRLRIQPEEIQGASAASIPTGPKAVICDGIPQASKTPKLGCDVIWSETPTAPDLASVEGLWRSTLSRIRANADRGRYFDPAALSSAKREWLEKLIKIEFKPAKRSKTRE